MNSDELKVPSQRNDAAGDDAARDQDRNRDNDSDSDNDKDRDKDFRTGDGLEADAAHKSDLADSTERETVSESEPGFAGAERHSDNDEAGKDKAKVHDGESEVRGSRVDDEYVAVVPDAVPVAATTSAVPAAGGAYDDDDPAYRDPYGRTGGDMLAEPEDGVPASAVTPAEVPAHAAPDDVVLFDQDPTEVQARWRDLQTSFVDDPGEAVQRADGLVAEVVESLTSTLTTRTSALRDRWKGAESSDTEQLRLALRDYRTVLERLLALSSKSPTQYQNQGTR